MPGSPTRWRWPGPGGWGVLDQITAGGRPRPVVAADAGYGDNTAFRLGLATRRWLYVVAVKGATGARPHDAVPEAMAYGGRGRPSVPCYRAAQPAPTRPHQRGQGPAGDLAAAHQGHQRQPRHFLVSRERDILTSGYRSGTMAYAVDCGCGGPAA